MKLNVHFYRPNSFLHCYHHCSEAVNLVADLTEEKTEQAANMIVRLQTDRRRFVLHSQKNHLNCAEDYPSQESEKVFSLLHHASLHAHRSSAFRRRGLLNRLANRATHLL